MRVFAILLLPFLLADSTAVVSSQQCDQALEYVFQELESIPACSSCLEKMKERRQQICAGYQNTYDQDSRSTQETSDENFTPVINYVSVNSSEKPNPDMSSSYEGSTESSSQTTSSLPVDSSETSIEQMNSTDVSDTEGSLQTTSSILVNSFETPNSEMSSSYEDNTESSSQTISSLSVDSSETSTEEINSTHMTNTKSPLQTTSSILVNSFETPNSEMSSSHEDNTESSSKTMSSVSGGSFERFNEKVTSTQKNEVTENPSYLSPSSSKKEADTFPRKHNGNTPSTNNMYVLLVLILSLAIGGVIVIITRSIYKFYRTNSHTLAVANNTEYELNQSA